MKRFPLIIVSLLAVLVLAACTTVDQQSESPSSQEASEPDSGEYVPPPDPSRPEGAVAKLFEGARTWNTEVIEEYLPAGSAVDDYVPAALQDAAARALRRMEYSIGQVTAGDEHAYVEVEVTSVDVESAMGDAVGAAIAYVAKQQLTGKQVDDFEELAQVVSDAIDIEKLPTKTISTTAYMVRDDSGDWMLDLSDEMNLSLFNAVTGGSVELVDRFQNLAETYGFSLK